MALATGSSSPAPRASPESATGARAGFDPAETERELLARCERLVERARALGADEAEACASGWRSISVRFEKGDLKLAQVDVGSTVGLRVFRGGRLGFAATNQSNEPALETCAADALALAACAPPDAHNALPAARSPEPRPVSAHPGIVALPVERAVAIGTDLLRSSRPDPRLSIDSASVDATSVAHVLASSRGARASESDAQISLSVFGMAVDGADVGGFHYTGDQVRDPRDVAAAADAAAREFSSVALGNLAARKAESYSGPVLFSPDALLEVFVAPLVSASSAIAVQRGRSALAGKVGQLVAAAQLTVLDDPSDATLAGATGFDREGQPCGRFAIVERGILASYLYNVYAAAVEKRLSTGHARGTARAVPGLGVHALSVAGGNGGARADLEGSLARGLFVQRFSGTVDPASGDFSGVAKSARWIDGGAVSHPVRETLIAGNVFALLPRILALSTHPERCSGEARAPFALVDGVTVTAG